MALGDTAGGRGGCGGGRGRGVASPRDRHPAEGGPEDVQLGPVTHPGPGRGRPCLASGHAPATGVNGSQTARPPPGAIDRRLGQSQRAVPSADQSARARGGAPLTSRPLPASMGPAGAAERGPAAAHPRFEPRSASFSQSLQCSRSFSSAGGR